MVKKVSKMKADFSEKWSFPHFGVLSRFTAFQTP